MLFSLLIPVIIFLSSIPSRADTLTITFAVRDAENNWTITHQRDIERDGETIKLLSGPNSGKFCEDAILRKGSVISLSKRIEIDNKGRTKLLGIPLLEDIWTDEPVMWP